MSLQNIVENNRRIAEYRAQLADLESRAPLHLGPMDAMSHESELRVNIAAVQQSNRQLTYQVGKETVQQQLAEM